MKNAGEVTGGINFLAARLHARQVSLEKKCRVSVPPEECAHVDLRYLKGRLHENEAHARAKVKEISRARGGGAKRVPSVKTFFTAFGNFFFFF